MLMEGIDVNQINMNGILQNAKLIIVILDFIIIELLNNVLKNVVLMILKVI